MRGCKTYGGQPIKAGAIIYRQLGTKVGLEIHTELSLCWRLIILLSKQECLFASVSWSRMFEICFCCAVACR